MAVDFVTQVFATVHHTGDDEYCLQIELGNERAVTLTVRRDEGPSVAMWHGRGEHSFVRTDGQHGASIEEFREFVAAAFEPRADRWDLNDID